MKIIALRSLWVLLVLIRTASGSEGSIDFPSTAAEAAQFYLVNQVGTDVVFYLQTASLDKTETRLKPGESNLYSGRPGETWMNISIYTEGQSPVEKHMESGKRYYLQATDSGAIDIFMLPPK